MKTNFSKTKNTDSSDGQTRAIPSIPVIEPTGIASRSVADIAANDFHKAGVFQKYGIDFCCGGNLSLEAASRKVGISEGELRSALQLTECETYIPDNNFYNWTLAPLVEHIVNVHHRYIRDNAMTLMDFAHKVAGHFGKEQPELQKLETRIGTAMESLMRQMDREEKVLFPAIRQLAALENSTEATERAPFQFILQSLAQMQMDNCSVRQDLLSFRRHTRNYDLPVGACNSYAFLFNKLKEFEANLKRHMHLENDILFPKSIALLQHSSPDSSWYRDRYCRMENGIPNL
jgi:regulator of cell morphogenesis and NO signaling